MKKTVYGIVVAVLGAVLGAGAMFLFGLGKPATPAPAPQAAAPAPAAKSGEGEKKAADGGAGKGAAPAGAAGGGSGTPVELGKPEKLNWPKSVTAVGSLRSDESVIVRAEQSGRITALNFKEGQPVKAGQVLVQLDDSLARAELEQAKANQKLAKAKFDRAVELQQKNFISGQARDEAENALRVADATVSLAEAKLTKLVIKSPFSGTVGLRSASVGDYVKDGQDIVNLEKTDPIKVDFKVPELFQSKISVGQALSVSLDALPGKPYSGRVYAVNPQLDTAGRAVVLRAQMDNHGGALKPGMFARVRLTLADTGDTVVVPEQSVAMQGEEQIMFKVVDGRAMRTKVEVGQRRDGKVEIVEGISGSDTIVVAGWQRLRDGAAVRPASGGSPAAGGADMAKAGQAPKPGAATPAPSAAPATEKKS
ncbi:efflux RND transporter periplasmic adaptor subunit [Casimicrobium huifangae]|uniref:efflux RND transporter periplasmic adaptor subunit n=1 Tax=Casimicrobium huifangae TaxID=2591109 RepID=UPI00378517B1